MNFMAFSEDGKGLSGLIGKLKSSGDVHGVTLAGEESFCAKKGASTLTVLNGKAMADNVFKAINSLKLESFDRIFINSSPLGRDLAGMLASELNSVALTEVIEFSIGNESIKTKRFFYGGKTIMEEESKARIVTTQPGSFDPPEDSEESKIERLELEESSVKVLEVKEKEKSSTNIELASILVSVGRGIGKKEAVEQIMPLVDAVHGELSGSRPVCLDYKWLSEERQVGLSGKKVKPKVYIALGISGQIQHIAGMRGSKIVVAVNKDKDAPIFQECDYGIVGDLFQVVPKLVSAIKS